MWNQLVTNSISRSSTSPCLFCISEAFNSFLNITFDLLPVVSICTLWCLKILVFLASQVWYKYAPYTSTITHFWRLFQCLLFICRMLLFMSSFLRLVPSHRCMSAENIAPYVHSPISVTQYPILYPHTRNRLYCRTKFWASIALLSLIVFVV